MVTLHRLQLILSKLLSHKRCLQMALQLAYELINFVFRDDSNEKSGVALIIYESFIMKCEAMRGPVCQLPMTSHIFDSSVRKAPQNALLAARRAFSAAIWRSSLHSALQSSSSPQH